jgi:hypothetical protein
VSTPEITAKVHAGTGSQRVIFGAQNDLVGDALFDDISASLKPQLAAVLEAGVRVLLWVGWAFER